MTLWPGSLLARLMLIILPGLLLANGLSLSLVLAERMASARTVMLNTLGQDVATSVAILDRLPAVERPAWLARLNRGNYRYVLGAGQPGPAPVDARSRAAIGALQQALDGHYSPTFSAVPGNIPHFQLHLRLGDGAPLTLDVTPHMAPVAGWLPVVLLIQLVLLVICAWLAVRHVVRPIARFTRAAESIDPATDSEPMPEQGPVEVRQAARAFNSMQSRIQRHLKERAHILAAISHDLQTPITRMKLRVEMAAQPALRDKLNQDLDNMTRLVREGIAYARTRDVPPEPFHPLALPGFLDSLVCDYVDTGKHVTFVTSPVAVVVSTRPQALRRIMTNLVDNALKFASQAEVILDSADPARVIITIADNGPGIPESELEAVFQPFYRLESSRNRATGGTGLGLAIARQLAQQLGGELVLSNAPDGGLRARLALPRNVSHCIGRPP
ncbi:HAMP domain-containing protein [Shimwellia pseudoproteus]|uniref:ATP-binding protein n=1 Tax=Shimwellia pseudoproteus TaxID=570012 RepID=UPI0018EDEF26|nr:ATP-binding protein [Shimwellia pseudoproteus]MBJ3814962.1 HAMP domain-containing protein [Shimwellia pseudoproteus]